MLFWALNQLPSSSAYFFTNPPQKQKIISGKLSWEESLQTENIKGLFCYIRRVRNNLFHGGKFPSKSLDKPKRNEELLKYAITLLEYSASLHPEIKEVIESTEHEIKKRE